MTLSKSDIEDAIQSGELDISRPGPDNNIHIEPSSVDLHLGDAVTEFVSDGEIRATDESTYPKPEPQTKLDTIRIEPKQFLLAHTEETISLSSKYVAYLHGRSSIGRLGLFVENAGLVDTGFSGDLTLELFNASDNAIILDSGMRICQLTIHEHTTPPAVTYSEYNGNKYQGQRGPTPSRLYDDSIV